MENVLIVENLKYKNILKDITFSLKEKSFNILIGASGSGKTTIVNCIRDLINYEGNINFLNSTNQKDNSDIGFFLNDEIILEGTLFEELLTLLKNLNYGEDKAKKRIYAVAKKLDVIEILFKEQKDLLMFEKTLVSFIFSIIHDPKLLIIDNDLENLDQKNKSKIFDYLKNQKKLTILFITNNSDYFIEANNLLFLNEGKIVLSGSLDEVAKKEKIFIKCGSSLPFMIDLSNKLMVYELLNSVELDIEKMVNKIWK